MFSGKSSSASKDMEKGGHELADLDQNNVSRFQVAKVDGDAEKDDSLNVNQLSVGHNQGSYDSRHKSQLTREVPPRAEHYRDLTTSSPPVFRPTLEELHEENFEQKQPERKDDDQQQQQKKGKIIRFGWLEGVFMRCLLNIWGVMLFLRLSWVIGQAGIGEGAAVIILANIVTIVTTISMSAVCTNGLIKGVVGILVICIANLVTLVTAISMSTVCSNGKIRGGGIYYMISRSLGPEFGGAIGLMFTLANSIAVSMYIVGFCESLQDLLKSYDVILIDGATNDIRVVGLATLIAILILAIVGMDWVTRTQMVLLVVLIFSQIDFVIGTILGPKSDTEVSKGFVGYNKETFKENLYSDYRAFEGVEHNFFSVFAVFFPAVTGIVAGANLSGDLKDPSSAIPIGTLLAILVTFVSYVAYGFMVGGCMLREASGNITEYIAVINTSESWSIFTNCTDRDCRYGLHNDSQAMELVSWWGPLIYGGCFAATLSSAIASLVGAPRVLQALAKDKLYPFIGFFSEGFGANNDPVRGYVLVFCISFGCILIAQLNAIAPLLSNFFLAAYALINFSVFHASISRSPGWRPAFKYYNAWVSLIGTLLCIAVMFLISWWTALITFVVVITLYLYVSYRKPEVNWGSSTQAQSYSSALKAMQELNRVEEHVKNYRPQILVLSGMPGTRPQLLHFSNLITKGLSLNICGYAIKGHHSQRVSDALARKAYIWLRRHRIKSFFNVAEDENYVTAVQALIKISGLGKLKPNMLLMGYKNDWQTCDREELLQYFDIIHYALDKYLAVGILRVQEGLDYSGIINDDEVVPISFLDKKDAEEKMRRNQSAGQLSQVDGVSSDTDTPPTTPRMDRVNISTDPSAGDGGDTTVTVDSKEKKKKIKKKSGKEKNPELLYTGPGGVPLSKDILNNVTLFQRKQKKGFIDVWWLYDDGGLTLLIPYILSTKSIYSSCKLRIFSLATSKNDLDRDQRNLAALLSKFRIEYSDVVVIPDITRKAQEETKKEFEALIENFRSGSDNDDSSGGQRTYITDTELIALQEKTNRHMRLRELLLQHSQESTFVVMALPIPRKGTVSAPLYMAWLELLTKGMPPSLLVRGNQTSVLTYYS